MIARILPHATVCEASDRFVILDVRRDRYSAVPEALGDTCRAWLHAGDAAIPASLHQLLLRSGILRPSDPEPHLEITHAPRLDALDLPAQSLSPISSSDILRIALTVGLSSLWLRFGRLQSTLNRHALCRATGASALPEDVRAYAAEFDRARRLVPAKRNCLLDTLALDRWLGHDPECCIVFGVTAAPFAAHCWLQRATTVLNDSPDRASRFTPILTV